jgi:hypothetical protein
MNKQSSMSSENLVNFRDGRFGHSSASYLRTCMRTISGVDLRTLDRHPSKIYEIFPGGCRIEYQVPKAHTNYFDYMRSHQT